MREKYGINRFGQSCLLARRLVEAGVRFVTINMFETVFDEITWDIPRFEAIQPNLLVTATLSDRCSTWHIAHCSRTWNNAVHLKNTWVGVFGEFGRTPR